MHGLRALLQANGHGTVLFHEALLRKLRAIDASELTVYINCVFVTAYFYCCIMRVQYHHVDCVRISDVLCRLQADARVALARLLAAAQLINQVRSLYCNRRTVFAPIQYFCGTLLAFYVATH